MENTYYIFVELWGYKNGECGADYLYDGEPLFFLDNLTRHQAYLAGTAIELARKYAMSVYVHEMHPQYDEIDLVFFVHDNEEDTDHIDDAEWCQILYLKED